LSVLEDVKCTVKAQQIIGRKMKNAYCSQQAKVIGLLFLFFFTPHTGDVASAMK
jgi:hypothetical protein